MESTIRVCVSPQLRSEKKDVVLTDSELVYSIGIQTDPSTHDIPILFLIWQHHEYESEAMRSRTQKQNKGIKGMRRNSHLNNVEQLCELIIQPEEPLALRLSSNLMIGVARSVSFVFEFTLMLWIRSINDISGYTKVRSYLNILLDDYMLA